MPTTSIHRSAVALLVLEPALAASRRRPAEDHRLEDDRRPFTPVPVVEPHEHCAHEEMLAPRMAPDLPARRALEFLGPHEHVVGNWHHGLVHIELVVQRTLPHDGSPSAALSSSTSCLACASSARTRFRSVNVSITAHAV